MMKDKNIDRLFQDKLKDLDVAPNPEVWTAIEGKLQKKKRRVLPYWWLYGSVAAVFVLGLFLFPFSGDDPININKQGPEIITTIPTTPKENINIKKDSSKLFLNPVIEENTVIATKTKSSPTNKNAEKKTRNAPITIKEPSVIADNLVVPKENTTETIPSVYDTDPTIKNTTVNPETQEKKIITTIPSNKTWVAEQKNDSILKKNPLYQKKDFIATIQAKDSLIISKSNREKWSVAPVVAVLNSNSFTQASPIHSDLNENPMKGKNTMSYGVKVAYQINSKWSVQSGVHMQKMSFLTKTYIAFGMAHSNIETIDFNNNASAYAFPSNPETASFAGSLAPAASLSESAQLEQAYGYVEVPFEVKYRLIEGKKINTSLIAGFSSLFLTYNQVKAESFGFSESLGKANNLNSINFSGNLGVDIDYAINKSWIVNINPMFKSQFNTFSNNSNGFRPYSIGVYTGVKYQF
jgi:hypothetical protein